MKRYSPEVRIFHAMQSRGSGGSGGLNLSKRYDKMEVLFEFQESILRKAEKDFRRYIRPIFYPFQIKE